MCFSPLFSVDMVEHVAPVDMVNVPLFTRVLYMSQVVGLGIFVPSKA